MDEWRALWKVVGGVVLILGGPLLGVDLPSREQVLDVVYPEAEVKSERVFLTRQEMEEASRVAGEELLSALVGRYLLSRDGRSVGRAYVDTHVVRSKKESLLVCLDDEGRIVRVEVTAFLEPPEYLASEAWYAQYSGKDLSDNLRLQRSIRSVAGATLTAMAASKAVRRVLGIDQVLRRRAEGEEN